MKKCHKCNVLVDTERKTCPLCFEILKLTDDESVSASPYPKPENTIVVRSIFLRVMSFLTIIGVIGAVAVNFVTFKLNPTYWSLIVVMAVGYFWILIKSTFRGNGNVPMRLVVQMIALSILTYSIDRIAGYGGWSINYVIPFLSILSILAINFILIGNGFKYNDYLLYLFAAFVLGFIPSILWVFNRVDLLWPSLSAVSFSFSTIVGMLIFADRETKEELKKRFHI